MHSRLRGEQAHAAACILDPEIHHRLRNAGSNKLLELLRRRWSLRASGSDQDSPDDELSLRVIRQQQESGPRGDVEQWLVARSIENALGTSSSKAADPGQRAKKRDLAGRYFLDRAVN